MPAAGNFTSSISVEQNVQFYRLNTCFLQGLRSRKRYARNHQPRLTRRSADQRWSTPINEKSEWPLQYFYTMVKIPFSTTRCRACHRKSQNFKFVIPTDWSTLLFSVRVTQSCKFASFKYKADGLMHAPPKLNSLLLVGDNYQLNSFQPTMGYQGTNVNFLAGLIGVFELIACFLILKLPPVTCKLRWRLILHLRL